MSATKIHPMDIFDAWFIRRLARDGWPVTVAWWHRMMRHQEYFAGQIISEIKLEDRLDLPEGSLSMATLYGEGD